MSDAARRYERNLSIEQHALLEAAHRELRDAVAAYERFLGAPLDASQPVPVQVADERTRAWAMWSSRTGKLPVFERRRRLL